MTTGEIITLLQARGFRFTHSLGQNFLIDDEMLEEIVRASGASGRNVLEIGAGAGCLTNVLARSAKRVLAIEIDKNLIPVLETVLQPYKNVTLVQGDVLKVNLEQLAQECFGGEPFDVVANLPYYITTPVLFRLLESGLPVERICVMLQKEAVQRVMAQQGDKEYMPESFDPGTICARDISIRCHTVCAHVTIRFKVIPFTVMVPKPLMLKKCMIIALIFPSCRILLPLSSI